MSNLIKPLLAKDVNESKLKFPLGITPKIDGSFAFVQNSKLYARSLKQHENLHVTEQFSREEYNGLRGELILELNPIAPDLCRNTSSALRTIQGKPLVSLWCFDHVLPETVDLPYFKRIELLEQKVRDLDNPLIKTIPLSIVYSLEEYIDFRDTFLAQGFEGVVVRDLHAKHKEGRSSSTKPDLWRYKPWSTAEIRVTRLVEELKNNNQAVKNELGQTERSTHKDNLEGKQTLGAIVGDLVTPLLDNTGKLIADIGTELTIATGSLTAKQCKEYWDNPNELVGKIAELDYMSFGLKDKPRFSQFKRIRSELDMGE
jgi:DNA ligase-1